MGLDSLYHGLKPQYRCSRGRVHRLMKALGIHSLRKKAYLKTTHSNHVHPIAPNLLNRQFTFAQPNQVWVGDITYIPIDEGWLYLAMVKDLCTKKVVGYAFSERIDTNAENFFSCLKCELIHLCHYVTRPQAPTSIFSYIEAFYNSLRPPLRPWLDFSQQFH